MTDFIPAGATTMQHGKAVSETVTADISYASDNTFYFSGGEVGVVVETGTFTTTNPLEIEFTEKFVPPPTLTATRPITGLLESQTLKQFTLEVRDTTTTALVENFSKPVRIVVDVRDLIQGRNPAYDDLTLSYWDADIGSWRSVPSTIHQAEGLLSAEVTHFSEWSVGSNPNSWTPTWTPPTVAAFSGAATYAYPFNIPPGRQGLQPSVTLSYSSRAIDGHIHKFDAGPVAHGWSLAEINITRSGVKVRQDTGNSNRPEAYHPDEFTLVLNGTGYDLIPEYTNTAAHDVLRYFAENEPGLYVERIYDSSLNTADGIYWLVRTSDGTTYRLGYTADSEEWQSACTCHFEVDGHKGHGETPSAIAWHVDTVTDVFGNQMRYLYQTEMDDEDITMADDTMTLHTQQNRIKEIFYNYKFRYDGALPITGNVPFPEDIAGNVAASSVRFLPNSSMEDPINSVEIYHNNTRIREYTIATEERETPSDGCNKKERTTTIINSITEKANDLALPPTTFSYVNRAHHKEDGKLCFFYAYLSEYKNGYGGHVEFTYSSDNRSIGSYDHFEDENHNFYRYPEIGYNWFVTQMTVSNGLDDNATTIVQYEPQKPCYGQWVTSTHQYYGNTLGSMTGATKCWSEGVPEFGNIVGFAENTQTTQDYTGTDLTRQKSYFNVTSNVLRGTETKVESGLPDGNGGIIVHGQTETSYYSSSLVFGPGLKYKPVKEVITTQYDNGIGSPTIATKVAYFYEADHQGNTQYGNVTRVEEYDDATASDPYRVTESFYRPNDTNWIVSRVSETRLYDGNIGFDNLHSLTYTYYDDNTTSQQAPTQGAVTRVRQAMPTQACVTGSNCDFDTVETTMTYDDYGNVENQASFQDYGEFSLTDSFQLVSGTNSDPGISISTDTVYESGFHLYPTHTTSNPSGFVTSYQVYGFGGVPADNNQQPGLLKRVMDHNQLKTRFEYDVFGRLVEIDVYDDGPVDTVYQYHDTFYWREQGWLAEELDDPTVPFVISTIQRGGEGDILDEGTWERQFFDGLGRVLQTQRPAEDWNASGTTNHDIVQFALYDAQGKSASSSTLYEVNQFYFTAGSGNHPYQPPDTANQAVTVTNYDDLGRVEQTVAFDGSTTDYAYEILNNSEGFDQLTKTTVYDANGHALAHFTDARGQLVLVREFEGTTGNYSHYGNTFYEYDVLGNLTSVQDTLGNITTINYDALGRKTSMDDPDMGHWEYEYDAFGNLIQQRDAKDRLFCFYYDELSRLTAKVDGGIYDPINNSECPETQPSTSILATYTYYDFDAAPGLKGQLHKVSWGDDPDNNYETFTYYTNQNNVPEYQRGLLETHNRVINGRPYNLYIMDYDLLGRPLNVLQPNGELLTYTYDREGENTLDLSYVLPAGGTSATLVSDIKYNERGQMTQMDLGNGINTNYTYYAATDDPAQSGAGDSNFRLKSIQASNLLNLTYTYDKVGNISSINDSTTTPADVQTFTYDHLNRLQTAVSTSGVADYDHTYNYDQIGNITSIERVENSTTTTANYSYPTPAPTPDPHNQPHAVKSINDGSNNYTFTYDDNGNMITRHDESGNFEQEFDIENRLVKVTDISGGPNGPYTQFYYDANGQRVLTEQYDDQGELETATYYPFPGYEEEVTSSSVVATPIAESLSTNALPEWKLNTGEAVAPLQTNDEPGWDLAMTSASDWATDLLPWDVNSWTASSHADFPGTSLYDGPGIGDTTGGFHAPNDHAVPISNLADGYLESATISDSGGNTYDLSIWLNHRLQYGTLAILMVPEGGGTPTTIWSKDSTAEVVLGHNGWAELSLQFTTPSGSKGSNSDFQLRLVAEQIDGWVAWDNLDLSLVSMGMGGGTPVLVTSFESDNWTKVSHQRFSRHLRLAWRQWPRHTPRWGLQLCPKQLRQRRTGFASGKL